MRTWLTLTAAALVAFLGLGANSAQASHVPHPALVDGWYHRYLGRPCDPVGRHDHLRAMRRGTSVLHIEAAILSSPEYYHRCGATPEGFVFGLYRDVLGCTPNHVELRRWTRSVLMHGRYETALRFLHEERVMIQTPVVMQPAPVVLQPAPVMVRPPVVAQPVVPIQPFTPGGMSINFRFGR